VKDESGRRGDETRYHNINTTRSDQETDNIPVGNCDREHHPGRDDGKDLSRTELG
jgi:hypothetical protein